MLFTPPPGYNPPSVNQQNVAPFNVPGQQGGVAQGYYNPYKSSYSLPSSYSIPSSINVPNPYWQQQAQQAQGGPANMVRALRGM